MDNAASTYTDLLSRARQQDAEAVSELCRRYEPRLRVVARVLLGPALRPTCDSMDLVQSVHRSMLAGLQAEKIDISTPENLMALTLTLLRRKIARHWRRAQRQVRSSPLDEAGEQLSSRLSGLPSRERDPQELAEYGDEVDLLSRRLTPDDQQIVNLRLQGHTTAEIAQKLGLNHITVRVRMTRLRERLRNGRTPSTGLPAPRPTRDDIEDDRP